MYLTKANVQTINVYEGTGKLDRLYISQLWITDVTRSNILETTNIN